ncbi:MAG: hypothetical protein JWO95_2243 [Verrucomicrobiales bacterium]|nr:hypothetical protein [Verrucomicrobiales bacterium]
MDDLALLRQFVNGTSDSFTKLVDRHIGLVYSAAFRQTGNATLAEDVTQAVFIILAKKAGSISERTILAGWLFRTTRFVAAKAVRSEVRRRQREQEAAEMQIAESPQTNWQDLAPLLDESMAELADADRDALLLRFFENQTLDQVGHAFGISEDAAQKRVTRALEKLRHRFSRKNIAVPAIVLGVALSSNAVHAVPVALQGSVAAVVSNQTVVSTSVYGLVKLWFQQLLWTKIAINGAIAATIAAATIICLQTQRSLTPTAVATAAKRQTSVEAPTVSARTTSRPVLIERVTAPVTPAPLGGGVIVRPPVVPSLAQTVVTNQSRPNTNQPLSLVPSNRPPEIAPKNGTVATSVPKETVKLPIDSGFAREIPQGAARSSPVRKTGINIKRRQP